MWKLSETHWINPENVSDIDLRGDSTYDVHFSADDSIVVRGQEAIALRAYLNNASPEGFEQ